MRTTTSNFILFALGACLTLDASAQQKFLDLDSSNSAIKWEVQPKDVVKDATSLFTPNFSSNGWVRAVVPGTVFTSYVEAGLEKDPNFGDNIYKVDKAKYEKEFWYRTAFKIPKTNSEKTWLNFEGINRKGEVYFNGQSLGKLDGFMQRGKFEISKLVRPNAENVLAVLVDYPKLPIPNLASPTYISSSGWDWMPHVPGLLSGITDDVYLTTSNQVTLTDPWVRTDVPSLDRGEVSLQAQLDNHATTTKSGTLSGVITPGNIRFSVPVSIAAGQSRSVNLDKTAFPQFVIRNPKLWWPNGYGAPNLYRCELKFTTEGKTSDLKTIPFGIKKYTYDTNGDVFHLHINGKPVFMKGGNWGMSEYMLRCRGEEYDLKVKLHRDMNFNMIRNWIGSTTDEELYEACDKYGILIWDDFWLNSHPNLPTDLEAFNNNSIEKIKRLRNHPSIAVWCGDNEGTPQPPLNDWLRRDVQLHDGGDRWYQPNSNTGALSGSGFWV
ncbi:beta-mannosidase, partial [bacterium]